MEVIRYSALLIIINTCMIYFNIVPPCAINDIQNFKSYNLFPRYTLTES